MGRCRRCIRLTKQAFTLIFYACAFVLCRRSLHAISMRDDPPKLSFEGNMHPIVNVQNTQKCIALMQAPKLTNKGTRIKCKNCTGITCEQLLAPGTNDSIIKHAADLSRRYERPPLSELIYLRMAQDCSHFVRRNGYHMMPVDKEEASFPIAYNIIMHHNVEQVEMLLRAIYRPQNAYCIHVDADAQPNVHKAIRAIAGCLPNVFVASHLLDVVYAGFSRLQADINCMLDHVSRDGPDWRYLINVAGEAFPLRTNGEIVRILKIYNGANDVEGLYGTRVIRSRFQQEFVEAMGTDGKRVLRRTGKANPPAPHGIEIVRGSAYVTLSRAFVEWMLSDPKAKDLLEWSKHTYSPDEMYWATLNHIYINPQLRTPGGYAGMPNTKPWLSVYAAWGGRDKCHGRFVRGVCVFGVGDLASLVTRKELMLNKFHTNVQPLALQCMATWIERNSLCPPDLDYDYYRRLPFVITSSAG